MEFSNVESKREMMEIGLRKPEFDCINVIHKCNVLFAMSYLNSSFGVSTKYKSHIPVVIRNTGPVEEQIIHVDYN